jgi:lipoate-protein ligase B
MYWSIICQIIHFKATQHKFGSFRVTVDGVPKALDILHKEKRTYQLVKAVTKRCQSSTEPLKTIPVIRTKRGGKTHTPTQWIKTMIILRVKTFKTPANLTCV